MKKNENSENVEPGVVLLTKMPGKTSFSSLSIIKKALGTGKVGHTGTLDSFADGLLVVLAGKLTKLVPHITNFDKTYLALIEFGTETDTLDPTGEVIKNGRIPTEKEVSDVLADFFGTIDQVPPSYSALHVNGKRASEIMREGKTVELPPRKITIHSISLLDFYEKYALIEVSCSKGTYIRSLARDIAEKCGSCAHLKALRRTRVGPFFLTDAVGSEMLPDFTISSLLLRKDGEAESETEQAARDEKLKKRIKSSVMTMTMGLAEYCGMIPVVLSSYFIDAFSNGRPLDRHAFSVRNELPENATLAVFYPKGKFAGVVEKCGRKFSYGFVVHQKLNFTIYSWNQIMNGEFPEKVREQGTALCIGSFDGPHIGHDSLFDAVVAQSRRSEKALVPGIVSFKKSLRGMKDPEHYPGDVASLSQRLESFAQKGFAFALIIDFSSEFGRIEGLDFLKILVDKCGMKYLAEGKDFHCGYRGSTDMSMIGENAGRLGFSLETVDSVLFKGEKVSSSRIRQDVCNGNFDDIKVMLDRPFALDCSDFEWKEEVSDGKRSFFVTLNRNQLLPPDGLYKVRAIVCIKSQKSGEAQNVRAYRSDCMLEKGNLRLSYSDKLIGGFVRAIQFGYPEEIKL